MHQAGEAAIRKIHPQPIERAFQGGCCD
jgi:hypothetical protein